MIESVTRALAAVVLPEGAAILAQRFDQIATDDERALTANLLHEPIDVLEFAQRRPAAIVATPARLRLQPDREGLGKVLGRVTLRVPVPQMEHKIAARLIGSDAKKDVALLWTNIGALPSATPAVLASSGGSHSPVQEGERVFTIGSPLSLDKIITTGIVSKVDAHTIMSDININPGNSGGPLFNTRGDVIGVNTALYSPTAQGGSLGIGFAIPGNDARVAADQLRRLGHLERRGQLGHARLPGGQAGQDRPPGRIGQRVERRVQHPITTRFHNHMVSHARRPVNPDPRREWRSRRVGRVATRLERRSCRDQVARRQGVRMAMAPRLTPLR